MKMKQDEIGFLICVLGLIIAGIGFYIMQSHAAKIEAMQDKRFEELTKKK